MEPVDGLAQLSLVHEVVPLRYLVVHRASRVRATKGSTAVHASRGLDLALHFIMLEVNVLVSGVELAPVSDALEGVAVRLWVATVIDEAAELCWELGWLSLGGRLGRWLTFSIGSKEPSRRMTLGSLSWS